MARKISEQCEKSAIPLRRLTSVNDLQAAAAAECMEAPACRLHSTNTDSE